MGTTIRTAAVVAALALVTAAGATAQPADALLRGFEPTGDWKLLVNGAEVAKAKLYDSQRAQALLILTSEFESPILIDKAGRAVATLNLMKVAQRPDGTVDLLADAVLEPASRLTAVDRVTAEFTVEGKRSAIRAVDWKLGPQDGPDLLQSNAEYRWRAGRYTPDAEMLDELKATKGVRVLTFFGSWCPHCKEHLPALLEIERELGASGIDFDYYGLPSPFGDEPEARRWGIDAVPTAIVFVDGVETGRVASGYWTKPEAGLLAVLPKTERTGS